RYGIAQHDRIDEGAADIDRPDHRIVDEQQSEYADQSGEDGEQHRADIVNDAAGADAQALQADRHREHDADLQRRLGQRSVGGIDVAGIRGMADFHEGEQYREQDRG